MSRTAWLHHGLGTISREEAEQRVQRNGLYLGASRPASPELPVPSSCSEKSGVPFRLFEGNHQLDGS